MRRSLLIWDLKKINRAMDLATAHGLFKESTTNAALQQRTSDRIGRLGGDVDSFQTEEPPPPPLGPTNNLTNITSLEQTLMAAASPALVLNLLGSIIVISAVFRSGAPPSSWVYQNNKLWKTRHIFQVKNLQ